jgi:phosphoribosylformimino-5-aminoimidazole carboxamide ribotide isomerase
LRDKFPSIRIIASGGVSSLADLDNLKSVDVDGVIIGKAIYEGKITLQDLSTWQP